MTKFEQAVAIAKEELAKGELDLRKRIIARLVAEANMTPAGASTYASNATKTAREGGPVPTSPGGAAREGKEKIVQMGYVAQNPRGMDPDKIWSACALNNDIVYHAASFFSEAEADKYCARWGCKKIKGVPEIGKPFGTIIKQEPFGQEDTVTTVDSD